MRGTSSAQGDAVGDLCSPLPEPPLALHRQIVLAAARPGHLGCRAQGGIGRLLQRPGVIGAHLGSGCDSRIAQELGDRGDLRVPGVHRSRQLRQGRRLQHRLCGAGQVGEPGFPGLAFGPFVRLGQISPGPGQAVQALSLTGQLRGLGQQALHARSNGRGRPASLPHRLLDPCPLVVGLGQDGLGPGPRTGQVDPLLRSRGRLALQGAELPLEVAGLAGQGVVGVPGLLERAEVGPHGSGVGALAARPGHVQLRLHPGRLDLDLLDGHRCGADGVGSGPHVGVADPATGGPGRCGMDRRTADQAGSAVDQLGRQLPSQVGDAVLHQQDVGVLGLLQRPPGSPPAGLQGREANRESVTLLGGLEPGREVPVAGIVGRAARRRRPRVRQPLPDPFQGDWQRLLAQVERRGPGLHLGHLQGGRLLGTDQIADAGLLIDEMPERRRLVTARLGLRPEHLGRALIELGGPGTHRELGSRLVDGAPAAVDEAEQRPDGGGAPSGLELAPPGILLHPFPLQAVVSGDEPVRAQRRLESLVRHLPRVGGAAFRLTRRIRSGTGGPGPARQVVLHLLQRRGQLPGGQFLHRRACLGLQCGRLEGRREPGRHLRVRRGQRPGRLLRDRLHLGRELAEQVGPEQADQQGPALVVVGAKEAGELPLGQHHDLAELLTGQAQQVTDDRADLVLRVRAAHPPLPLLPLEVDAGPLPGHPAAAPLGPVVLRRTADAVAHTAHRELERDLRADLGGGEVRAHPGRVPAIAGQAAVQGEGDRIEDRGLPDAGRALEEEQPAGRQPVEVDHLLVGERADRDHAQGVQAHQAPTSPARQAATA